MWQKKETAWLLPHSWEVYRELCRILNSHWAVKKTDGFSCPRSTPTRSWSQESKKGESQPRIVKGISFASPFLCQGSWMSIRKKLSQNIVLISVSPYSTPKTLTRAISGKRNGWHAFKISNEETLKNSAILFLYGQILYLVEKYYCLHRRWFPTVTLFISLAEVFSE